eukprot:7952638-Prorocentrum_lima.AAC.1
MAAASSCAAEAVMSSFLDMDVHAAVAQDSSSMKEDSITEMAQEPTCPGVGMHCQPSQKPWADYSDSGDSNNPF